MKLVVADDHKDLRAAAAKVFSATHQRCRVHRLRNALAAVPPKQRPAAVAMLKTIFAQNTAEAAHAQWRQVADALRERFPKLGELMDGARDDVLDYMTFPRDHWAQIASTNPLDEWAVSRRYMSLESLAALSDDPILRLSAVAA